MSTQNPNSWAWQDEDRYSSISASLSLTAPPFPSAPTAAEIPPELAVTVAENKHLFRVVCPINVSRFEALLVNHPNQPLVKSVVDGLRKGFWPGTIGDLKTFPATHDGSRKVAPGTEDEQLMIKQCEEERRAGRYSESIGTKLLPGMHALPQRIVKKDGKARLVTDHSCGKYAPNSLLPKEGYSVNGDNIGDFVRTLCQAYMKAEGRPLVLFKSDVAKAYRNLPMHPYWQARQVVKIGGQFYVDRCNSFGSRASGLIWCTFYSLVLWIAEQRKCIFDLFAYIDDNFSFDFADSTSSYAKYDVILPNKQVQLLKLWDDLGIPHEKKKQVCGTALEIIGYKIDVRTLKMCLPDRVRDDLLAAVVAFAQPSATSPAIYRPLRLFHRIVGLINWASKFHLPLRIGSVSLQKELAAHAQSRALERPISVNRTVIKELAWLVAHINHWRGASLYSTISSAHRALQIQCDASLTGIGFHCGSLQRAHHAAVSFPAPFDDIAFAEAFAIACAINWAASLKPRRPDLCIHSDNTNAVHMFTTFQPIRPEYAPLLMEVVDLITALDINLHVCHISGSDNGIADLLSRGRVDEVKKQLLARYIISPFKIPDKLSECAVSPPVQTRSADNGKQDRGRKSASPSKRQPDGKPTGTVPIVAKPTNPPAVLVKAKEHAKPSSSPKPDTPQATSSSSGQKRSKSKGPSARPNVRPCTNSQNESAPQPQVKAGPSQIATAPVRNANPQQQSLPNSTRSAGPTAKRVRRKSLSGSKQPAAKLSKQGT